MKQFLKNVFASAIGTILALWAFGLFLIFGLSILIMVSSKTMGMRNVQKPEVLRFHLSGAWEESVSSSEIQLQKIFGGPQKSIGLIESLAALKEAKNDPKIKGVYLHFISLRGGWASYTAFRRGLEDFKKAGKFIIGYGETLSEADLYLSTVCDEMYLFGQGMVELNGLALNPIYFKNLLEKLELKVDIFKAGQYKSAVEPFFRTDMSPEDREQRTALAQDLWQEFLANVSAKAGVTPDELNGWVDKLEVLSPAEALSKKLITGLSTENEVLRRIGGRIGYDAKKPLLDMPMASLWQYLELQSAKSILKDRVGILLITGEIIDGESRDGATGSATLVKALRELEDEKNIKALIVRVNSPGGSAMASDVIWHEIEALKKRMPVVASYGDMAASGGYYSSVGAQKIFAESTTITGSIGVFGLRVFTRDLLQNKAGIHFDRLVTNSSADLEDPNHALSEFEKMKIQNHVELTYGRFKEVVQQGRKFKGLDEVETVASGRVWSGVRAQSVKLVDAIGGVMEAADEVARMAKLKDYDLQIISDELNPLQQLLEDIGIQSQLTQTLLASLGINPATHWWSEEQGKVQIMARTPSEWKAL